MSETKETDGRDCCNSIVVLETQQNDSKHSVQALLRKATLPAYYLADPSERIRLDAQERRAKTRFQFIVKICTLGATPRFYYKM